MKKVMHLRGSRKIQMMAMMMSAVTLSQICVVTKKGMGFYCLVSLRQTLVNSHQLRGLASESIHLRTSTDSKTWARGSVY